jgi:hypothetical protein
LFVVGAFVYARSVMLQNGARTPLDANARQSDVARPRDRMPTLPYDLEEYAWLHTGPKSWSADEGAPEPEVDLGDRVRGLDASAPRCAERIR